MDSIALARAAQPRLRAAFAALLAASAGLAAWIVHRRGPLACVLTRIAWWSSLAILLVHGLVLADLHAPFAPELLRARFVAGFGLCLPAVILGEPRSLRVLAIALAIVHATLALLLHELMTGTPV